MQVPPQDATLCEEVPGFQWIEEPLGLEHGYQVEAAGCRCEGGDCSLEAGCACCRCGCGRHARPGQLLRHPTSQYPPGASSQRLARLLPRTGSACSAQAQPAGAAVRRGGAAHPSGAPNAGGGDPHRVRPQLQLCGAVRQCGHAAAGPRPAPPGGGARQGAPGGLVGCGAGGGPSG